MYFRATTVSDLKTMNLMKRFACPPKHQTLKNREAVFQKYNVLQIGTSVSILIIIFSIHFLWFESLKVIVFEKH